MTLESCLKQQGWFGFYLRSIRLRQVDQSGGMAHIQLQKKNSGPKKVVNVRTLITTCNASCHIKVCMIRGVAKGMIRANVSSAEENFDEKLRKTIY